MTLPTRDQALLKVDSEVCYLEAFELPFVPPIQEALVHVIGGDGERALSTVQEEHRTLVMAKNAAELGAALGEIDPGDMGRSVPM